MSRDACADKTIVSSYAPANVQIKTGVRSERFIGLYGAISGWQHRVSELVQPSKYGSIKLQLWMTI